MHNSNYIIENFITLLKIINIILSLSCPKKLNIYIIFIEITLNKKSRHNNSKCIFNYLYKFVILLIIDLTLIIH